ncbi:MAG: glycosyltransferase family 2 protein, partial [Methanobrevibacter sp.]|nr:glycosyltransferase family 2 protein [Methanobrevibacter sp.]
MTELELIEGKPKIFTISSDDFLLSQIKEYVEDYNYEDWGSAHESEDIFSKIDTISPNLIFLDTEEEGLDLLSLTGDLELFNVPIILIVGALFDETIDKLLMSNPFGYLLKPLDKDELQRAMAVALKKHEQNIINVKLAEDKIREKNIELMIEKSDSSLLLVLCVSLIIIAILSRNATWLQWVLLIPTFAMLINSIVSA